MNIESIAIDLFYLAGGLYDDDCHYGNQRNAPAILVKAWVALGRGKEREKYLRDVFGDQVFEDELEELEKLLGTAKVGS